MPKKNILCKVQEFIDQIYADFEYVESEGAQAQVNLVANTDTAVATKVDKQILERGPVATLSNLLLRGSVFQRKQLQSLTRIWHKL